MRFRLIRMVDSAKGDYEQDSMMKVLVDTESPEEISVLVFFLGIEYTSDSDENIIPVWSKSFVDCYMDACLPLEYSPEDMNNMRDYCLRGLSYNLLFEDLLYYHSLGTGRYCFYFEY